MDPLQQLLGSSATKAYLDDSLKAGVVGAMGACLKAQPQNALAFIGDRLNATNPARKQSTMQLTIDGTTCTLTKDRLDKPQQRRYRHPALPLVADMNPTRDDLYKLVNIVRDVHAKQQAAAAAEIAVQNGDQLPEMKDPAANMASAKRRVSIGKIEQNPSSESVSSSRVKLLLVAPVDAEIVFVNGVPMVSDYRRVQARTAKEESPDEDDLAAVSGEGQPGADGDDYSGIQRADSGPGTPQSPPINCIPRGHENVGDDPNSEATSEMDLSHTRVPAKYASPQKKRGGLTIIQCEDLVALHAAKQPGVNALPFRQMGDFVSSAFSTSGIHIEYSIVRTPDRYAVSPQLFDSIDEFVGLSDAAPIVPTIVAVFCPRTYLFRNVLSAVVSALAPIEQVASFAHNSSLLSKRQAELKAREARNEAKLVNAAAYWAKVRARREHRDKLREQKAIELLKRAPAPPLASNATDEERAAYEQRRKEEELARAEKERAYEEAAHRARVVRQARRSREDTAAAEVMRAQEHSSGTIINTVLRGYLVRRRLRNKLSDARARIAARFAEDSSEHSPLQMAMSVRSMRQAKRPHAKDELDCIRDCLSHPLEHKLVNDLLVAYNETLTFKPPAAKPPPRCYDNWVPRVKHIPATFDGEVSSDEEDWSREELTVAPILQTERYRLINPIGRLQTVMEATHNSLFRDIDVIADEFGNVSPLQRQAYAMLHTKILHIFHTVFLEVSHREMLPTGVVTFTEFVAHHTPQLDEWFAAPWEVASSLDTSIRAILPTIMPKSAVPSLLQRKTHFLVYDSGAFDAHAIHSIHRDSEDDEDPAEDDRSAKAGDDGDLVVTQVPGLLGSPARAESRSNHDRTQSGGLNQSRSHADSRRTTSASAALPGTPQADTHLFQRLQPCSPVFMAPDGAGLEVVKAALGPLVHAEAPTCVLWISLTAEPTVYIDRKPYFLARRFEHQEAPEYPKFANYAAVSRVISTNSDDKSPEKTLSRTERRPSVGRISPVAGSLPMHHRQSTASSVAERSTTSIPDSTRSTRITPGSTAAAQEAAKRAAESTTAVAKVPYTANDVPLTAIVTLASVLGVSTLELEERLRAELLTTVDKAEGALKFFAHRSLASADVLVENPQTPGQYIVNDPYKHLAAMRANSTGSSPLGWSSPAASTVCSARSRECDRFDLLKTCIAVPKKEPPPRASIATSRGSMHYSMDQSFAFGASATGTHSTSPTPRNAASRAASQAPQPGPPPGSRSLRHRASMASMASMKSDQNSEPAAANAANAVAEATDGNRASLQLPSPDPLPELDQLPSIVSTPQQAFDDILANHLPTNPQTRNFVRCPMPRFGGSDWLKRYSGFIRTVFDHLQAGIVGDPNSHPRTVIVTALSSPDDAIYAATAEIVSALMFERFDPLQKSPREAAAAHAQDPSMDAVFASVRMCAGASTSMTPNTPRKNPLHRSTVDVHDRAFGGLVALDVADPTLMIGRAMKAVDAILKRAGLYDAVKGRVVRLRQSAEIQRGTPCCRTAVRECCCALERYAFMVFAASLMQARMRGLKATAEPECIDLFDAVTNTVAGESMEKFISVVDPWATATQLSPDPTHVDVYTKGPARWRELYFVDRALDRQQQEKQ